MGTAGRRGPSKTYLAALAGEAASTDVFDGIDTTWNRVPGGAAIGQILTEASRYFLLRSIRPKRFPLLLKARRFVAHAATVPGQPWAALN